MKLIWSQLSPEAKNEAAAIHIAKLSRKEHPDYGLVVWYDGEKPLAGHDCIEVHVWEPDYLTNANPLLSFLAKCGHKVETKNHASQHPLWWTVRIITPDDDAWACKATFCEAAMIALLRANGVEVEA